MDRIRFFRPILVTFVLLMCMQATVFGTDNKTQGDDVFIQYDHSYTQGNEQGSTIEQATIIATDANGNMLWSYQTESYPAAQVKRIKEIGLYGDTYYFCEDGTITALEAHTGKSVWTNSDFGGSPSGWDFDEEGNLYICGSLGPDLFVMSKEGATILREANLPIDYFEPVKLNVVEKNKIIINFIGGPEFREEGFDVTVELNDTNVDGVEGKEVLICYDSDEDKGRVSGSIEDYDDIILRYKTALEESWDIEKISVNGLCYLCRSDTLDQMGYSIQDINGDGIDELLIGEIGENGYWGLGSGMFYDLYTKENGMPVLVIQSAERSRYYLCDNGTIANEASGGSRSNIYAYYTLEDAKTTLTLLESVIGDGYYDEQNPWFYSTTSRDNPEEAVHISSEEADAIINQYTYANIQNIPLSEL